MKNVIIPIVMLGIFFPWIFWSWYVTIESALSGTLPKYVAFANGQTFEVRLAPQRKLFEWRHSFKGMGNTLPWRRCIVTDADSGAFVCRGCTFSGASKRAIRRLGPRDPNASFRKLTLAEAEERDARRNAHRTASEAGTGLGSA